jgi:hydroxyacyl-ACP dehydratase HTD2-like protein with hotdog domain
MKNADRTDFDVALPLVLPELVVEPTAAQVFMFSAATWNRHHIHYSRDAAVREGHADIVVQRALLGNVFARHVQAWLGAGGSVQRLAWKLGASALPGQPLRCNGVVSGAAADDLPGVDDALAPGSGEPAAPGPRLRYEAALQDDAGRTVATAEGVLCIHAPW